uniref:Alpha-taxilin n=1 Tax=Rhizophora mucronata TaxID=61149 RepID=A0A2P2L887_RHIMU
MENPDATQLPEVDALPDGFLESSAEPLAPATPSLTQEKPLSVCKEDGVSELDHSNVVMTELAAKDSPISNDEAAKLRTPPVPLSESNGLDVSLVASGLSLEDDDRSCRKQVEGAPCVPNMDNLVSERLVGISGCSDVKEHVQGNCQGSQQSIQGCSDTQARDVNEISSSASAEGLKSSKLDTTEAKRKSAKRTFKSEKEFLEFTLNYQKVLAERDGAIAVRDKLESLCRELQRQNKVLMEECKRVSMEGQNLRMDLSAKFQDAIKDVSNKLEEQKEESLSQLKENEMLRIKLKQLADQYTLSEQQHVQQLKQKTLELQLAELKIKQHEEKLVQEQSQMKVYAEQVSQLLATEKNLRLQLTADGEKFQQFQDALLKSNEVFETFKQEIEKMAKSIKELKKENLFLKGKCEKSDVTLIELVEEVWYGHCYVAFF